MVVYKSSSILLLSITSICINLTIILILLSLLLFLLLYHLYLLYLFMVRPNTFHYIVLAITIFSLQTFIHFLLVLHHLR